jgi:hypothetical protein
MNELIEAVLQRWEEHQYDTVPMGEYEWDNVFDQVIGDNGPTNLNHYEGPARVYALVIGPNGMETENT